MQEAALPVASEQGIRDRLRTAEHAKRLECIDAAVQAVFLDERNDDALDLIHRHLAQDAVLRQKIAEVCGLRAFPPPVNRCQIQDRRLDLAEVAFDQRILMRELLQNAVKCEQVAHAGKPPVDGGQMARFHGLACAHPLELLVNHFAEPCRFALRTEVARPQVKAENNVESQHAQAYCAVKI